MTIHSANLGRMQVVPLRQKPPAVFGSQTIITDNRGMSSENFRFCTENYSLVAATLTPGPMVEARTQLRIY